jgi:hypothetical protein
MAIWLSNLLLSIVVSIIKDTDAVKVAKKLIVKAVDSGVEDVGVTNEDAKEIIHSITESGLNTLTKDLVSKVL